MSWVDSLFRVSFLISAVLFLNGRVVQCKKRVVGHLGGRTGSHSPWFKWNNPSIPLEAVRADMEEAEKHDVHYNGRNAGGSRKSQSFPVQLISTLTRLGDVDVSSLEKKTGGLIKGKNPPEKILHGAVIVHGFVFEFIFDKGLESTEAAKYMAENEPLWYEANSTTTKTSVEVKTWLKTAVNEFNQGTYDIVDKNCMHFTKALCTFLGGPKEPKKFSDQQKWMVRNRKVGGVLQELLHAAYDPNYAKKHRGRTIKDHIRRAYFKAAPP